MEKQKEEEGKRGGKGGEGAGEEDDNDITLHSLGKLESGFCQD